MHANTTREERFTYLLHNQKGSLLLFWLMNSTINKENQPNKRAPLTLRSQSHHKCMYSTNANATFIFQKCSLLAFHLFCLINLIFARCLTFVTSPSVVPVSLFSSVNQLGNVGTILFLVASFRVETESMVAIYINEKHNNVVNLNS